MSPSWLTALVKARQAQEDRAQHGLAYAERRARAAHASSRHANEKIDGLAELSGLSSSDAALTAAAFAASAAALQSAAAAWSTAVFAAQQADLATEARRADLRDAAIERGAAEHLYDGALAEERAAAARIALREQDETAARVHRTRHRETS